MTLELRSTGEVPRLLSSEEAIRATTLNGGLLVPPSYARFALEWGYGTVGHGILLYVPLDDATYCDSLQTRNKELAEFFKEGLVEQYFEFEPDGSAELVDRLVPFGISENGHYFAWDPATRTEQGECTVYCVAPKMWGVKRAARDPWELLQKCLNREPWRDGYG